MRPLSCWSVCLLRKSRQKCHPSSIPCHGALKLCPLSWCNMPTTVGSLLKSQFRDTCGCYFVPESSWGNISYRLQETNPTALINSPNPEATQSSEPSCGRCGKGRQEKCKAKFWRDAPERETEAAPERETEAAPDGCSSVRTC